MIEIQPLISGNEKLVIRGPEWGNIHGIENGITFKKAMNGDVWTYIKKPSISKNIVISKVNRPKMKSITDFLIKYYGQRLRVTELFIPNNPVVWNGLVTSPIETIHQAVRDSRIQIIFEQVKDGSNG